MIYNLSPVLLQILDAPPPPPAKKSGLTQEADRILQQQQMFCCSFNFLSFKHTFEKRKKQQQHHTVRGFSGVTDVRVKKCVSFTTFTNSFSHWKLWEPQPPFLVLDESMLNVAFLFLITLTWITYSIVTLHVFLSSFLSISCKSDNK